MPKTRFLSFQTTRYVPTSVLCDLPSHAKLRTRRVSHPRSLASTKQKRLARRKTCASCSSTLTRARWTATRRTAGPVSPRAAYERSVALDICHGAKAQTLNKRPPLV